MQFETIIGLEVHVRLNTKSKLFSRTKSVYGDKANTNANIIDLGLPGVLPALNQNAVSKAIQFGLAINAKINLKSIFERKNYFYPDLPKGYQISQYELPIVGKGFLEIYLDNKPKQIAITRAHLEEDAGKSLHDKFHNQSGIDLNRAGTPLIEIVSEPVLTSAKEAVTYLKSIHALVCGLNICDGNMQEGSLRCDVNISLRPPKQKTLGTKVEIKNLNSFRHVEKAIAYEKKRQSDLLLNQQPVIQETRLYDHINNETKTMRLKEEEQDYRYFPDPDLLPLIIEDKLIQQLKKDLPELPQEKYIRFQKDYQLNSDSAFLLSHNFELATFFEATISHTKSSPTNIANWINGEINAYLNKSNLSISQTKISPQKLADLLNKILTETISIKIAKNVLEQIITSEQSVDEIISSQNLEQISDQNLLEKQIDEIINEYPKQFNELTSGKDKLLGFFIGKIMQKTKGKANPSLVNQIINKKLGK